MAYTFTPIPSMQLDVWGKTEVRFMQLQPAASDYPTGGYAVTPGTNISLRSVYAVIPMGITATTRTTTFVPVYNTTTAKIQMFWSGAAAVAGTISQPSFTVQAGTIGSNMTIGLTADAASANLVGGTGITANRTLTTTSPVGTPTFTGTATTAAGLVEVTASTDLSAWLFLFTVLGN